MPNAAAPRPLPSRGGNRRPALCPKGGAPSYKSGNLLVARKLRDPEDGPSRIADNYRRRHRRPDTTLADVEWRGAVLCAACGDVIGVYEPMIVITAGGARKTSRAREPQLTQDDGILLHAHCEPPRRAESREEQ